MPPPPKRVIWLRKDAESPGAKTGSLISGTVSLPSSFPVPLLSKTFSSDVSQRSTLPMLARISLLSKRRSMVCATTGLGDIPSRDLGSLRYLIQDANSRSTKSGECCIHRNVAAVVNLGVLLLNYTIGCDTHEESVKAPVDPRGLSR
jgi:hypothetical protein